MNTPKKMVWTPEMVQRFWDHESQFPEKFFSYRFGREIIEKMAPLLPADGQVVDYGCGPGNLVARLLELKLSVWALDASPDTIQRVRDRFTGHEHFGGAFTIDDLPDKAGQFDAVISLEVVEHLYDEQLDTLLKNVLGLLKPGGCALFTTPNDEDIDAKMIPHEDTGELYHYRQHVRSWTPDTLRDYLRARGFEVERTIVTDFCLTLKTGHRPQPLRELFKNIKKSIKYRLKPDKKKPHLMVVARKPA